MLKILLVDDDPRILDVTTRYLEREGDLHVTTARSGEEALGILAGQQFDAIVSDYLMEGCNGIELLKAVRSGQCAPGTGTPFIILTGKSKEYIAIDALNAGADFYLRKGRKSDELFISLLESIRGAIRRNRQRTAVTAPPAPEPLAVSPEAQKASPDTPESPEIPDEDPLISRFAASGEGVIITSLAGQVLFMNQPALSLLGLPSQASGEGRVLSELIPDTTADLALMKRLSGGLIATYRLPRGAQKPQVTTRLSRAAFRGEDAVVLELRV